MQIYNLRLTVSYKSQGSGVPNLGVQIEKEILGALSFPPLPFDFGFYHLLDFDTNNYYTFLFF